MDSLNKHLQDFVKGQVRILNDRIRMKLSVYEGDHEGFTDWHVHEPVFTATPTTIRALLTYSGLAAWIAEYGSGSEMDTNSPYYHSYTMNPSRRAKGNAFLGRGKGEVVYRPDGTTYISSGQAKGRNLEMPLGKLAPYIPQKAQHVIHQEIDMWVQEMVPELKQLVRKEIIARIKEGVRT